MYSRQGRGRELPDIPRDYSGNAFVPFVGSQAPTYPTRKDERVYVECRDSACGCEGCDREARGECLPETERCAVGDGCECKEDAVCAEQREDGCKKAPSLAGLSGLLGGSIGLEELLLLGVIFLLFADGERRDTETIICLLLILFI